MRAWVERKTSRVETHNRSQRAFSYRNKNSARGQYEKLDLATFVQTCTDPQNALYDHLEKTHGDDSEDRTTRYVVIVNPGQNKVWPEMKSERRWDAPEGGFQIRHRHERRRGFEVSSAHEQNIKPEAGQPFGSQVESKTCLPTKDPSAETFLVAKEQHASRTLMVIVIMFVTAKPVTAKCASDTGVRRWSEKRRKGAKHFASRATFRSHLGTYRPFPLLADRWGSALHRTFPPFRRPPTRPHTLRSSRALRERAALRSDLPPPDQMNPQRNVIVRVRTFWVERKPGARYCASHRGG